MNEAGSWALGRLLLGRNLSDAAAEAMGRKAPLDAFHGMVLADEFIGNVEGWLAGQAPLPQEARRLQLADDLLVWFDGNIPTSPDFLDRVRRRPGWQRFVTVALTDPVIGEGIAAHAGGHRNIARFHALVEQLRRAAQADKDAMAALRAEADETGAAAVQDFPVNTGPVTAHPETPAPAPDQPVIAPDELKSLRFDKDADRVGRKFARMYADKRWVPLFWLHRQHGDAKRAGTVHFRALAAFYAARMLLARNASQSAHAILTGLRDDPDLFGALTPRERRLFPQVLAQSLVRTGRAADAVAVFRGVLADDPYNADALFQGAALSRFGEPELAAGWFRKLLRLNPKLRTDHQLLIAQFALDRGDRDAATDILAALHGSDASTPDVELGFANIAVSLNDTAGWHGHLGAFFARHGLARPALAPAIGYASLPVPVAPDDGADEGPLVSIVMTSFNAADTLEMAVGSVLAQSHANLELFIVDDCSTDNSRQVIERLAAADHRVRPLHNAANSGTYVSKTSAILQARGDYVTFHDSDDWMHPDRLAVHLAATAEPHVQASISKWIRMDAAGRAMVRANGSFLHENPASTFIRRAVFDEIGYFDSVRTGADSELLWRMIGTYGTDSVVTVSRPLAVGLHHDASLTMSGATAFDEHRFSSVRLQYWESWVNWQLETMAGGRRLHVPFPLATRHCPAPAEILVAA